MSEAWTELVRFISKGESVEPGVANRSSRTIDQNTRYLKSLIEASFLSEALFAREVSVDPEVSVGQPVYYNTTNQRFEKAIAGVQADSDGFLATLKSSYVWGIVYSKGTSPRVADLLIAGTVEGLDLSNSIDDADPDGVYFLSTTESGKLIQQSPSISIPVLLVAGDRVRIISQFKDFLSDHLHYQVDLVARPAGEHNDPGAGNRHTITSADSDLEGWLPADHSVFEGNAPENAAFGYNISADAKLSELWPPIPLQQAYIEWDRGEDSAQGFHGIPTGEDGLVVLDRYGVWWMSDCYGDVPWPTALDTSVSDSSSEGNSIECPRDLNFGVRLWFTQVKYVSDQTVVTSLASNSDRITVSCALDGSEASTGDLVLDLDLDFVVGSDDTSGHLALKEIENGTNFKRGPVCESIYTNSSNVSLSSDVATTTSGSDTLYHGNVEIAVNAQPTQELKMQLVRLDGVTEEFIDDIMVLEFPASKDTEFRGLVEIPADTQITSPQVVLRFRILGRTVGTLPSLTLAGRLVTRPTSGLSVPVSLPTTDDLAPTLTTTASISAKQYVEAESSAISVAAGDQLFFSLTRSSGDAYAGGVGVLQITGLLSSGS